MKIYYFIEIMTLWYFMVFLVFTMKFRIEMLREFVN